MKDQLTTLMEALRLVGVEVEEFKRKQQSSDETLNALEAILYDPTVRQAIEKLEPFWSRPRSCPALYRGARARMKLVQIFLPLYDNNGQKFPARMYAAERATLVERFGGVTAYMRSPRKVCGAMAERLSVTIWSFLK